MSDVGERMLHELRRIREALEGAQPLGFGRRAQPVYVFVKHSPECLWYTRDKHEGQNVPIPERDLTGFLRGVWRFDREDQSTQQSVPKLMLLVHADRDYVVQSGFETNFSRSFLAGLLELPEGALSEPLTLIVEDNTGGKGRPTVFARLEWRGTRMTPAFNRSVVVEDLLAQAQAKFGLGSPFGAE